MKEGETFIGENNKRYLKELSLFKKWMDSQERIERSVPEADYYSFFNTIDINDSLSMANNILKNFGVGLATGCAFGCQFDSYLRLCYATSISRLEPGMGRLEKWLQSIK